MHDTPSHANDHLEFIWKALIQNSRIYKADIACEADGRTDGRMNGVKPIYPLPPTTSLCRGWGGGGGGGYYKLSKIDDMENGIEPLCSYLMNRGTGFH